MGQHAFDGLGVHSASLSHNKFGIDSKIVRDRRVRGHPVPQDKAVIVQDRLVVATVGEVNFAAQKGKRTSRVQV